ncbi:MAG: flagellar basal body protein FliL [Rhodobacteraceae bacterium]|nr:flagellar basal body protein FliL [Paracoccaceae bacterium]
MTDAVADTPEGSEDAAKKTIKAPLIIGLVLALAGGGGGFFVVQSELLPLGKAEEKTVETVQTDTEKEFEPSLSDISDIAFLPLDPILISINDDADIRQLRFRAQVEVPLQYQSEVEKLMPRIIDVLNGYLRAVEPSDLKHPMALTRLRSQMLRRINIVSGQDRVRDLLIMEFVLN